MLCVAPQNVVEFWSVATRPVEVLQTWRRIVVSQSISGKQAHDAHLVAMMQVHSIPTILTFNDGHFKRFPGITALNPKLV